MKNQKYQSSIFVSKYFQYLITANWKDHLYVSVTYYKSEWTWFDSLSHVSSNILKQYPIFKLSV